MIEISGSGLATALKAVTPHASTDSTLPGINAVNLRVVGMNLQVTATDRYTVGLYRLAAASNDDVVPHPFGAVITLADAKRLMAVVKALPAYSLLVRLGIEKESEYSSRLVVESFGSVSRFELVEAEFPRVDQFVTGAIEAAKDNVGAPIDGTARGFNPKLHNKFEKAADKHDVLVIWPTVGNKPQLVTVGSDFVGIIMIVRGEFKLPTWVDDTTVTTPVAVAA